MSLTWGGGRENKGEGVALAVGKFDMFPAIVVRRSTGQGAAEGKAVVRAPAGVTRCKQYALNAHEDSDGR